MEDRHIITLYQNRDETAVSETVKKYERYCATVAQNILGNREDAEECVNDTWLRAWNAIPPACPNDLRAYLAKITRRLALDRLAKRQSEKRGGYETPAALEELSDILSDPESTDDALNAAALSSEINAFLHAQPRRAADMFVLRYFCGEPVAAIAVRFAMTPNTASAILSRTRKKLKKHLLERGYSL